MPLIRTLVPAPRWAVYGIHDEGANAFSADGSVRCSRNPIEVGGVVNLD